MKDFLILGAITLFIVIFSFKFGAWYGHEKAIAQIQTQEIAVPIPLSEMVAGSSADFYNTYMLKNCLMENKILMNR